MTTFANPEFQAYAAARSAEKRTAYRELKFALRSGELSLADALEHWAVQDKPIGDIVGFAFCHGSWKGESTPRPERARARRVLEPVHVQPTTRVKNLSAPRRAQIVQAWLEQPGCPLKAAA